MDNAWRVKCSSALTSPPPSGPPLPPMPPPQLQPPTSVNQMDVNPRLFSHPFSVQEPLAFQSVSSNFAKLGETELSNSFLALLSGHPQTHSLLRELSQFPCIRSAGGGATAAVAKDQIPSVPIFSGNSTSSNTREVPAFVKPLVPSSRKDQTFQGLNAAQSVSCNRPEKTVQQRMQREVSSAVASHDSARSSRRPRVMCMNTVGELFLSELGLLGVLCFCHKSRMSVAKFCEHSGSAGNPGEAVRLENGVTVAQWRKQCFGNHSPDDGKGWDWSEGPTSKNGFVRSSEGSFPIFPQNSASAAFQTFVGIGKSGDNPNRPIFGKPPGMGAGHVNPNGPIFGKPPGMGAGHAAVVHLTNKVEDRPYQRNKLERPNHSTMSFFRASQCDIPSLAKNQMVYPVRTSPDYLMPQASSSIINKGDQNVWCHLVTNNDNFKGKSAMPSVFYPYSDAKDSSSWECSSSRKSFASDALIAAREGSSSNIDLRLGQPSQVQTSLSSVPSALNPLQFVICDPQKLQTNLLPPEKNDYPLETKKPRIGLGCTTFEAPAANRGLAQQAVGFSNSSAPTGSKELAGVATKNLSISSFLSHLNTERSNTSQLSNTVESKISVLDLVSSKFNIPEHISDANGLPERKKFLGPDSFNTMDTANQLRPFDNVASSNSKANYQVQSKQAASTRVLMPASDGPWLHHLQFSKPPTFLQSGFDSKNSHGYGRVPSIGNRGNCNRAIDSSTIPVSYASSIQRLSNSVSPTDSSLNSRHISEPTVVTHSRNIGHSQHLVDDSVGLLALRQIGELSRQEKSTASINVSSSQQRQCCHSGAELRRTLCCGDPAGTEELRQGTCCVIQQNVPKVTGRSEQPCSNCCSANCAGILAAEWGKRDAIGHCKCRSFTQRVSQCSEEQDIPTCRCCGADKHSCSRLGRIPNCTSASVVFDENAQTTSFSRGCCCSNVLLKHVSGCCLSGGFSPSVSCNKQSICGSARTNFFMKPCYEDHAFQDRGSTCLCECTKRHFVVKNDVQAGLWRDVPAKKIGHSDATSCDNPAQELKNSSEKGDQLPGIAPDGRVLESVNEQQMSNACSGSSAPAVTEVSVEVNKAGCCTTNAKDYETAYNFGAGEGSGVEKCGSSDEASVIREGEGALVANSMAVPTKSGNFLPGHSPCDPIDERRLDISSNKKTVGNQINIQYEAQENVKKMQVSHLKADKSKGQVKFSELDMLVPKSGCHPPNSESSHCVSYLRREYSQADGSKSTSQSKTGMQKSNLKRKRSSLSSTEPISQKRNSHHNIFESDKIKSVDNNQSLRALDSSEKGSFSVDRRKQFAEEGNHMDSDKPPKYMSLSCIAKSNNKGAKIDEKNARPVVCGKTGIILCGGSQKKPVKIVSLNSILERSKRCDTNESEAKPQQPVISQNRKMMLGSTNNGFCKSSELQHKRENSSDGLCKSSELQHRHENSSDCKREGTDLTSVIVSDANEEQISRSGQIDEISMTGKETDDESNREEELALHHKYRNRQTRPRYREVRECSLSELLRKDKCENKLPCAPTLGATSSSTINATNQTKPHSLGANGNSFIDTSSGGKCLDDEDPVCELDQMDTRSGEVRKCQPFVLNSDVICCVCGSSDKAECNSILQCKCCFIKVHQACYGVSKVPRGPWHCRPCKANSRKTVCVLCGYEGGAMTRAVKTQNVVKSLLKAWNFGTATYFVKSASCSEIAEAGSLEPSFANEAFNCDIPGSVSGVRSASSEAISECPANLTPQNQTSTASSLGSLPKEMQQNSVIAGVLDPSVVQWVHMVCSLWTPGTRCPNVDTMSAFDVSGASAARKNTVCSMCNRPGGCCIKCRVRKCSVHFHPWCAHQKGLLQSEVEGDDNENVGFYGRCMLHAARNETHDGTTTMDVEVESPRKEFSCARIEIFKGRKRDRGFKPDRRSSYSNSGGCIVSQEQINAWLHINGQRSCTRAVVKFPSSDVEHDCRKEYFRYKQSKAWKHLVVYKSGIHALGLYTSQLIFRGAMVVEYVGEIVGPRVADKREIEYQSGKRLQYKSACYFFRIDKEHIIDATRKGGIARFVNHSCTPNCVAKIISVRNEKKVVFFAERDINPGEEITYDYHFNSEDEGQKIPCYCNSKNCRLYLN